MQYFLGFLGLAVLFACQKERARTGLAAAGVAVNLLVILSHLLESNPQSWSDGRSSLRVFWWNVHSGNKKVQSLFDLIDEESPDGIALAEANSDWKHSLDSLKKSYPYRFVEDRKDSFGIAFYA